MYQLGLTVTAALAFLLDDKMAAISALVGGLINILPNAMFILITHKYGGAQSAKKIMRSFYLGEVVKILLTATLFASTFIFLPVKILPLLVTYIICVAAFFAAGTSTSNN